MSEVLWDRGDNPNDWVARQLGIPRHVLRARLHKIKDDARLGGADRVSIMRDGTVLDENGDPIGNLHDD